MNNSYDPYSFVLSGRQRKRFEEWKKQFDKLSVGPVGGTYTFSFTPTSIGTFVSVKMEVGTGDSKRIETFDLTEDM
jgi:hypothetical protein